MNPYSSVPVRTQSIVLLYFMLLFSGLTHAQVSKVTHMSSGKGQDNTNGANYKTFSQKKIGNLNQWRRFNTPENYNHPEFGVVAESTPCENCVEVLDRRKNNERYFINTQDTTVFYKQQSLGDINYLKDGKWVDLTSKLKPIGPNRYESGFYSEPAGFEVDNKKAYIKTPSGKVYFNDWTLWKRVNGIETQIAKANWTVYTVGDDGMYIQNVFDGIDAELRVSRGQIKTSFIMKSNKFGIFDDLIFKDEFAANTPITLDFTDTPGLREAVGAVSVKGNVNLLEINPAVIYPKGEDMSRSRPAAYSLNRNKMGIVVPFEWINSLIGQYELVIDPAVTGTNSLSVAAITGSMFNASCNFNNSCNYTLNVNQPAATTITDIGFTFSYYAYSVAKNNGGFSFSAGSCATSATNIFNCTDGLAGECYADTPISIFSPLQTCLPAKSCNLQSIPFRFHFFRSCVGTPGCNSNTIAAYDPLVITITGKTVEVANLSPGGAITLPSTSICAGKSMNVSAAVGINGVPGPAGSEYTYSWSFSATGLPVLASTRNASITFPNAGTSTLYLSITDSCGRTYKDQRNITVNTAFPAAVTITANPAGAICSGTPVVFTATPVNGGTPSYVWRKNGSIVGGNSPTYNAGVVNNGDVIIVTMTSTLSCSNSPVTSTAYTVVVAATPAPIPDVVTLPNITAQCTNTTPTSPTAKNPCTGATIIGTAPVVVFNTQGSHTITWTYNDGAGNTSTQTQTVIIDDTQAPVPAIALLPVVSGQCSVIRPAAPTANDICKGIITATTTSPATFNTSGVIVWTFDDGNGNTITQNQTVTISDTQAPVPVLATLPVVTGQCSAARPAAPTANDNCAGIITATTTSPATFNTSGVIVWTYNDGNGNTIIQNQTVTINDTQAPVPVIASLPVVTGQCSAARPAAPTANDNCGGIITATTTSPATFNTSGVIVWTYNDGNGNTIIQNQTVTINDTQAPVPVIASLPVVTGQCSVARPAAPTANDNCAGIITATTTSPATFNTSGVIVWTYNDGNGNTIIQNQTVTINDTQAPVPVIASLPVVTGQCSAARPAAPTANDNCAGIITATTTSPATFTTSGTIVWTYDDGNGNTIIQNQTVTINDNQAPVPVIAALPVVTGQCSAALPAPPTANDNCAGIITATTSSPATFTTSGIIVWTYDDGNGNTTIQNQTVTLTDNQSPIPAIASLPIVSGQCSAARPAAPTATDNCAGIITATTTSPATFTTSGTIVWTYDDGNGNTVVQNQTVTINDNQAPIPAIASLPVVTGQCSAARPTAPTATDNCAGVITATTLSPATFTTSGVIVWTYDDGNGNTTIQNQTVTINDTTAPVPNVAALPNVTGQCSVNVTTTPSATDNCNGTIIGTTTDTLTNITANTVITWTYDDGNGNSSTQTQNVVISDTTAPVPNVAALPNITAQCSVNVTAIPSATDNCSGNIVATTTATLTNITSNTVITWIYDDGNGNSSTQLQNVIISDTTAPVPNVAALPNITAQCSVNVTAIPTATDNCSGVVTATTATILTNITSNTVITWTYTDGNGNATTQLQNVIISDGTAPVPDVTALPPINGQCSVNVTTIPTATDNCAGSITATTTTVLTNITTNTLITWIYDDGNGNTSTQTQNVIMISDTTAPVPNVVSLPNITGQCSVNVTTIPTATDNCAGTVTATTTAVLTNISSNTTITWIYNDGNGNSSTQTQNIIVDDTIAPVPNVASLPQINGQCLVNVTAIPSATDNCSGVITATTTTVLTNITSNTVIIWKYDDGNGNTSTQTQNVVVADTTNPIAIARPAILQLDATGSATLAIAQVNNGSTDNCGIATITLSKTVFNCTNLGNNTVILTATDLSGNTNTATATVTVVDNIAPIVTTRTPVNLLLDASGAATLTIAQVDNGSSDNCAIATRTLSKTQFTCADAGANVVQFTVTDTSNNTTVQSVTVNVLENIAPIAVAVPTLQLSLDANGQAVITVNDIDAGSTDNCGIVTRTISKTAFDCTEVGNHTVTLTVRDGSGNSDTATTIVTILPIPKPTTQKPTQVFCLINNPTVSKLSVDDAQVLWFDSATATTSLAANTPLVSGSYFAAKVLGTCIGTDRLEVIVTVNDTNPPVGNNIELVCKENTTTLANLSVSGPSIRWYSSATGGTPIDESTIVYDGDTFYAGLFDGCESSQRLRIDIEFQTCEVIIYNAVSANGDRTNDYLRLEGISFFPENSIEIFNQWGNKVFGTSNYGTNGNVFRGFANSGIIVDKTSPLPFGTYYYILNYVDRNGIRQEKTGYLQLTH